MTSEEIKMVMDSEVKSHFALKPPPPPKEIIPNKTIEHFVKFLGRPPTHVEDRPSDYDQCIRKSYNEQTQQSKHSNKRGQAVPQLGEQAMQCPPPPQGDYQ
ncbi:hypothetical protein D1007_61797 [Hordeum vulgare]|nr:hypothetical protein D1007_61797 [Hordeum vulgare]